MTKAEFHCPRHIFSVSSNIISFGYPSVAETQNEDHHCRPKGLDSDTTPFRGSLFRISLLRTIAHSRDFLRCVTPFLKFLLLPERSRQAPRDGTALATRERQSPTPSHFCHWKALSGKKIINRRREVLEDRLLFSLFHFIVLSLLFSCCLSILVFHFPPLLLSALNAVL